MWRMWVRNSERKPPPDPFLPAAGSTTIPLEARTRTTMAKKLTAIRLGPFRPGGGEWLPSSRFMGRLGSSGGTHPPDGAFEPRWGQVVWGAVRSTEDRRDD